MRFIFKTDYDQDIRLAKHGGHVFWYSLLLAATLAAPLWAGDYWLSQLSFVLIYAVAGLQEGEIGRLADGKDDGVGGNHFHVAFIEAGIEAAARVEDGKNLLQLHRLEPPAADEPLRAAFRTNSIEFLRKQKLKDSINEAFLSNADEFLNFMSKTETDPAFGKFFFSEMFKWYEQAVSAKTPPTPGT